SCARDWSSDVCSSDLKDLPAGGKLAREFDELIEGVAQVHVRHDRPVRKVGFRVEKAERARLHRPADVERLLPENLGELPGERLRSEERREGEERSART